jgi:hypothetical protein
MSELVNCIEHVYQLMAKCESTDRAEVRRRIIRLFEEGIGTKAIIDALLVVASQKHEQRVLLDLSPSSDNLSDADFNEVEKILGVNEPTPENKAHWEEKFRSGRARYWCPSCGYSGNDEFTSLDKIGLTGVIRCSQCPYFEDARYFTRKWTPEEHQAFEAERTARRAAVSTRRVADAELKAKRATQQAAVRSEAVKAAKLIDEYQWTLSGEDPEDYEYVELESAIRTVMNLMLRPTAVGQLPVPPDDLVAYFKSNLRPTDDLEAAQKEFNRCVREYDAMVMSMEGL